MPTSAATHRPANHRQPAHSRLSARERGYDTAWEKLRKQFLSLNPLCWYCELLGRTTASGHVDHYDPAEPGTAEFLDESRLRASCSHHNHSKRDTPGDEYVRQMLERQPKRQGDE